MPAPPMRGNLHVYFDCVELRFIFFCEPKCSCKFHKKTDAFQKKLYFCIAYDIISLDLLTCHQTPLCKIKAFISLRL